MGNNELKAIDEGRRPPENRGNANAGRICGIVGVALSAIGIIFGILAIAGSLTMPFIDNFPG
jgi:hypothetical protein